LHKERATARIPDHTRFAARQLLMTSNSITTTKYTKPTYSAHAQYAEQKRELAMSQEPTTTRL